MVEIYQYFNGKITALHQCNDLIARNDSIYVQPRKIIFIYYIFISEMSS